MDSRRQFLSRLIAAGAVATLDPEKLLWVPGKTTISIPRPVVPSLHKIRRGAFTRAIKWEITGADIDIGGLLFSPDTSWSRIPAPDQTARG